MIAVIAFAAFLVGFSKAGVAGTLGPLITVLVALAIGAEDAVGLLLPILIIADWLTVAAHWRRWDLAIYRRLLAAVVIGIVIGSAIITSIDEETLRRIIALAMLAFAAFFAASRSIRLDPGKQNRNAWPAGITSGVVSTLAHLGGPPIFIYLVTTNLPPRRFVATSAFLFATTNLLKVPAYVAAGLFDRELILSTSWTWLMIPIGVLVGRSLVDRINREWFDRVTVVLLAAAAVALLLV